MSNNNLNSIFFRLLRLALRLKLLRKTQEKYFYCIKLIHGLNIAIQYQLSTLIIHPMFTMALALKKDEPDKLSENKSLCK
jgi:Zn-dependent M16 (insulinase) family peptidase